MYFYMSSVIVIMHNTITWPHQGRDRRCHPRDADTDLASDASGPNSDLFGTKVSTSDTLSPYKDLIRYIGTMGQKKGLQ